MRSMDSIVAAAAFTAPHGSIENEDRGKYAVAEANDGVAYFTLLIEPRNLEIKLAQHARGAIQSLFASNEAAREPSPPATERMSTTSCSGDSAGAR
jgi:hypothetical protein